MLTDSRDGSCFFGWTRKWHGSPSVYGKRSAQKSSHEPDTKLVLDQGQTTAHASANYMSSASTSHRHSQSIGTLSHRRNGLSGNSTGNTRTASSVSPRNSAFRMSTLLPFASGYRRVDAKDERNGRVSFKWKKFAIAAVVIIGLVWLFGPRERRESVIDTIKKPCELHARSCTSTN